MRTVRVDPVTKTAVVDAGAGSEQRGDADWVQDAVGRTLMPKLRFLAWLLLAERFRVRVISDHPSHIHFAGTGVSGLLLGYENCS